MSQLFTDSLNINRALNGAMFVRSQNSRHIGKYDEDALQKARAFTPKEQAMRNLLPAFLQRLNDPETTPFTPEKVDQLNKSLSKARDFDQMLTLFGDWFVANLKPCFQVKDEKNDFFGGMENQISLALSLTSVSMQLIKDSLVKGVMKFANHDELKAKLTELTNNSKKLLIGFSKTQMEVLKRFFNILGHYNDMPPSDQFLYDFNKKYFSFDNDKNPQELLLKKKAIGILKLRAFFPPLITEKKGRTLILPFINLSPAISCPALRVTGDGKDFISIIHGLMSKYFDQTVLTHLDKCIKL